MLKKHVAVCDALQQHHLLWSCSCRTRLNGSRLSLCQAISDCYGLVYNVLANLSARTRDWLRERRLRHRLRHLFCRWSRFALFQLLTCFSSVKTLRLCCLVWLAWRTCCQCQRQTLNTDKRQQNRHSSAHLYGLPSPFLETSQVSLWTRSTTVQSTYIGLLHCVSKCTNFETGLRLSMVLRLRQHNIGYTADGFYRSDDPTNSVKALKEGG